MAEKEKKNGAKFGTVNKTAMQKEKAEREKFRSGVGRTKWHKYESGSNFVRMLPPPVSMPVPWLLQRKHFGLGPEEKGFSPCTSDGKKCFICKNVKVLEASGTKANLAKADRIKVKVNYGFLGIDMTPLYSIEESGKKKKQYVADNPPPKCWGEAKIEEDEFIGKCKRCSWNQSCAAGIHYYGLSGQRIDDVAEYFDECDLTDLKEGRNILITKKGSGQYNTSYSINADEEFTYKLPKHIIEYIKTHFFDISEELKPATPEETEEAFKGRTEEGDLPECLGKFSPKKSKCKECE